MTVAPVLATKLNSHDHGASASSVAGPDADADADAEAKANMKLELRRLRQRNEELQSQVNSLLMNAKSQPQNYMHTRHDEYSEAPSRSTEKDALQLSRYYASKRPRPNSTQSDSNTHSGLHHRRSIGLAVSHTAHAGGDGLFISSDGPRYKKGDSQIYNQPHEKTKHVIGKSNYLCSPVKAMSIDRADDEDDRRIVDGQEVDDTIFYPQPTMNDDDEIEEDAENDDASHNKHLIQKTNARQSIQRSRSTSPSSNLHAFPPFMEQLKDRAGWLIGLLILQSCSSFIIQYNEHFLQNHMIIVQFLTMLVGAGGNAGNQASVRVIRSLAVGTLNKRTMNSFLRSEAKMAMSLSVLIGMAGFIRAAMFRTPPGETIAVTASVCAIVAISVAIGSTLPLGMKRVGIDPAHSSTSIQVVMDILGVLITVCVSTFVMSFKVFQNDNNNLNEEDDDLVTK